MIFFRRAIKNKSFVIGSIIILFFLALALVPNFFTKYDPTFSLSSDISSVRLLQPSTAYFLGTDDLGRDLWSRIVYGARTSLEVGLLSVSIALVFGTFIGLISGYFGKFTDEFLMRLIDIILAFPSILLAILIVAILGPGLFNAMIAIGIVEIPMYARLMRSVTLSLKNQEYIESARAIGSGHFRIIFRHILPNCLSPLIVQATLGIGGAILETAGLSFLGLGAQPPIPEWGSMLGNAKDFIRSAPWIITFPGIAIISVVLGFNLLGDGLRDLLDPYTKKT